jgi:hypothetical protein
MNKFGSHIEGVWSIVMKEQERNSPFARESLCVSWFPDMSTSIEEQIELKTMVHRLRGDSWRRIVSQSNFRWSSLLTSSC